MIDCVERSQLSTDTEDIDNDVGVEPPLPPREVVWSPALINIKMHLFESLNIDHKSKLYDVCVW